MTDIILTFVPFLAAIAFFIRARGEQKARLHAEQRVAAIERERARHASYQREWLATLAHELRTPLAAIIGYGELLEDGMFGQLDARGVDALARIRAIADQMLHLADGIDRVSEDAADPDDQPQTLPARELIQGAVDALRIDAEARDVAITVVDADALLHTRRADAGRALQLALGAAIKSSPGHAVQLTAEAGAVPALLIQHTRLDPRHDDPAIILENTAEGSSPRLTGPALRIGMARRIIESSLGGRLRLGATPEGCTVRIELPRLD